MLEIRCKNCGMVLVSHPTRIKTCSCPNATSIRGTNISGNNLNLVEIIPPTHNRSVTSNVLSNEDLQYQEQRRKRKIRHIDFEER